MELLQQLISLAQNFLDRQPALALAVGGTLTAVFLCTVFGRREDKGETSNIAVGIYLQFCRIVWATLLVALVAGAAVLLQSYLGRVLSDYHHAHGRLTETNLEAVRTIWGDEQVQGELSADLWWNEEETERIESEDLSKPAVTRKHTVRYTVAENPFITTRHEVTVRQNPRHKGSAVYAAYETTCRFTYVLRNPAGHDVTAQFKFPLPSASSMYDDLAITLNGTNELDALQVEKGALVLEEDLAQGETANLQISFKSRGLAYWYFQIRQPREVRDFELLLKLPDLPKPKLNYPEGCMTPTEIKPTEDGHGCTLAYRLDHAICNKGMGIELPSLSQPGETTGAVLAEAEKGWVLLFAAVVLGLTLAGGRGAVLKGVLVGCAAALGYGLLGDLSDTFLGFWGAVVLMLIPLLVALGRLTARCLPPLEGKLVAMELLLFGAIYPCLAALDADRETLYLNVCAFIFLAIAAWIIAQRPGTLRASAPGHETRAVVAT
jgi:hypothetical protein